MRKTLVVLLAVGLLLGLSLTGFVAPEKIKIGVLTTLTGGLAPFGVPIERGARLAAEQINAQGGILGRDVELVVEDTATNPTVGRDAATKLIEVDRVPAIIGALSSGVSQAVASVSSANEVVQISPASTSPALRDLDDDDYFWRTTISDALQGVVQGQLAFNLGYRTVSIIFVNNPYGRGLAQAFSEKFEALGGQVIANVPYEEDKASYRGEVEQAISGKPDAVNLIAYPGDGNKMLLEALELGYEGEWLFPDGMKGEGVAPGPACGEEVQALNGSFGTAPGSLSTAVRGDFDAAYNARFEPTTVPFHIQAYDAMALIAFAIARAGEATGRAIRDNLMAVANAPGEDVTYNEFSKGFDLIAGGTEINYSGVSGPITFDEKGDTVSGAVDVWTIANCGVRTVWVVEVGG